LSEDTPKTDPVPARLPRFDRHPRVVGEGSDIWCCFAFQDAMRRVEDEVYAEQPAASPRQMTA
jgi:hypothetical protein